jgi:hypothetical protein
MLWGALSDSRATQMVVLAPLLIVAVELWRNWWHRPAQTTAIRSVGVAVGLAVGTVATYALIDTRPGGWNTDIAVDVVMQTDENLVEAIGVLGWLDTVVPAGAVDLWLLAIGALVGAAILAGSRDALIWAAVLAGATVLTSWVLELVQGNSSGLYWQGRYSLPLLAGVPVIVARSLDLRRARADTVARAIGVAALTIVNVAAWAAARRFGVGTSGSVLPWRWNTPIQPVQPLVLLVAHAAASVWLGALLLPWSRPGAANHG